MEHPRNDSGKSDAAFSLVFGRSVAAVRALNEDGGDDGGDTDSEVTPSEERAERFIVEVVSNLLSVRARNFGENGSRVTEEVISSDNAENRESKVASSPDEFRASFFERNRFGTRTAHNEMISIFFRS